MNNSFVQHVSEYHLFSKISPSPLKKQTKMICYHWRWSKNMMRRYFFNQVTNPLSEYVLGPRDTKSHNIPSSRGHSARWGRQTIQCDKFFDRCKHRMPGDPREEHHTPTKTNFSLQRWIVATPIDKGTGSRGSYTNGESTSLDGYSLSGLFLEDNNLIILCLNLVLKLFLPLNETWKHLPTVV